MSRVKVFILFTLTVAISFILESIVVVTGLITGSRLVHHSVGPRLGHIPYVILIVWFLVYFFVFEVTNTFYPNEKKLFNLIRSDIILALLLDLIIDPIGLKLGLWTWETPGVYFGVPLGNFFLWILVVGIISFTFRKYIYTIKL